MFKQRLKTSLALTGVLILSGCQFNQSFSTDATPSYAKTSQVTTDVAPPSVGRSASQPGYGSVNDPSNVVAPAAQPTVAVNGNRSFNRSNSPVEAVTMMRTPAVTRPAAQGIPLVSEEPVVRAVPDDVITNTYTD